VTADKGAKNDKRTAPNAGVSSRDAAVCFAFVFAAAFSVYLFTLCPTFASEDSPELTTAAWTLGVAHPPGYPVYVIYGKIIAMLLPFGSVAWRLNLANALAAAAASGVVALIILRLTRSRLAAVVGGLALAFSGNLWAQAVVAEVYALNSLIIAILIYLAVRWHERPSRSVAIAAAGVCALGFGVHPISAFVAFIVVVFAIVRDHREAFRLSVWAPAIAMGIIVLAAEYGFTMWCSARNPYLDWGNPETFRRLINHFMREQYSTSTVTSAFSLFQSLSQIGVILDYLMTQIAPWIGPLCIYGAVVSFRRKGKGQALMFLGVLVVTTFSFMVITNFEIDRPKINANRQFWLPANTILAIWLGLAIDAFRRRARKRIGGGKAVALTTIAALLIIISPLAANWRENDRSSYYVAHDLAANLERNLPPGAILFLGKDTSFGLLYTQGVEGKRSDMELFLANANASIKNSVYRDLKLQWRTPITEAGAIRVLSEVVLRDPSRPVLFDKRRDDLVLGAFGKSKRLSPYGMLYKLTDAKETTWEESLAILESFSWNVGDNKSPFVFAGDYPYARDMATDYIFANYLFMAGLTCYEAGMNDKALLYHGEAISWAEGIRTIPFNCAVTAVNHGLTREALEMVKAALRIDPKYKRARALHDELGRKLSHRR